MCSNSRSAAKARSVRGKLSRGLSLGYTRFGCACHHISAVRFSGAAVQAHSERRGLFLDRDTTSHLNDYLVHISELSCMQEQMTPAGLGPDSYLSAPPTRFVQAFLLELEEGGFHSFSSQGSVDFQIQDVGMGGWVGAWVP